MKRVKPADALLAIDVGNTRIGMAISDADGIRAARRVEVAREGEWRAALELTWAASGSAGSRAIVMASVAPLHSSRFAKLVAEVCGAPPLLVRDDLPLPMALDVENPAEVGVDRVCAAAAAFDHIKAACAVASFGTAITIDCVSADGRFLGGSILPGLSLSLAALAERTALLPRIDPELPHGPFGRNTHDAICNGVVYGAVGALREIVERYATELHEWPQLVVTGGNAALIRPLADFVDSVVPDLCLMGVALAYRRAAGEA